MEKAMLETSIFETPREKNYFSRSCTKPLGDIPAPKNTQYPK